jgi:hypothetical protein
MKKIEPLDVMLYLIMALLCIGIVGVMVNKEVFTDTQKVVIPITLFVILVFFAYFFDRIKKIFKK